MSSDESFTVENKKNKDSKKEKPKKTKTTDIKVYDSHILHPITTINSNDLDIISAPFYGYAPSETPVRLCTCPTCHRPVSIAHLSLHQKCHDISKNSSRILVSKDIFTDTSTSFVKSIDHYTERQEYTFKCIIDSTESK